MPPGLEFLYEDNHVLVVRKPAGMLSQADLSGDLDVLTAAKAVIKRRDGKPGNVYLGLVHRLDRPVSGVMLLAKTSKAAGRLSREMRERRPRKIYRAVVAGRPDPPEGRLRHFLLKDRANRVTRVVSGTGQGKPAELSFRVLGSRADTSLVEVDLLTGLPHQIRAQLAAIGHPILGDRKYGSKVALPDGGIALYAASLAFAHPVQGDLVEISTDPPDGWPWGEG